MVHIKKILKKKIQSEIPHKEFQQSRFKIVYMVNHYSCCTYVNNQAKVIESRLILQTN